MQVKYKMQVAAVEVRAPRVRDVPVEVSRDGFESKMVKRYERTSGQTQDPLLRVNIPIYDGRLRIAPVTHHTRHLRFQVRRSGTYGIVSGRSTRTPDFQPLSIGTVSVFGFKHFRGFER